MSKGSPAAVQTLPLSLQQKRLWFLHQAYPGLLAYNIPFSVWLEGWVDHDALEQSLRRLMGRHEGLRLTCTSDGMARYDLDVCEFRLPVEDLRAIPAPDCAPCVDSRLMREMREPFDLEKGPLFRFLLLRLADERYVFAFTFHHLIFDGWSIGVLLKEIGEGYSAQIEGRAPSLPEMPVQYRDYVRWQADTLQSARMSESLGYWKRQLGGELTLLDAVGDKRRPSTMSHRGARINATLSANSVTALTQLCRSHKATLFVGLLAAYAAVLHRYSGETDILLGGPVTGRYRTEHQPLIGYLVNTVVYRLDLDGDPSFESLLKRARTVAMGSLTNSQAPFDQVVSELSVTPDMSRHPVFQFAIAYRNMPDEELRLPGVSSRLERCDPRTAKFDMTLFLTMVRDEVEIQLEYNDEIFTAQRADAILKSFLCLMDSAVAEPRCPVSQLQWLTPEQCHRLLVQWNDTSRAYPDNKCVHELFEMQAECTPHATAVVFEDTTLSYEELNTRANQLAHYLKTLGVGQETLVALCVERSLEMVVGALGILKVGAAYVPLDPSYPAKRLELMLEDTDAPVILTQAYLRERVSMGERRVVCLDTDWVEIAHSGKDNPQIETNAANLAYVIYTSGSTGRPKGVCIEHRGVVRLVKSTNYVELGPTEVMLQFAPLAFDASTFELWGSLVNGAKLVVAPPRMLSLSELGALIRQHQVSTLWLTAALFHQLVDAELETLRGVRQLLAGGETLSVPHTRRMIDALPTGHRLVNGYGPTENTTFTTCHIMTSSSRFESSVPIGRPVSNTRVYILDAQMQPVPVGVTGELYVAGHGLARGYLNRSELTREKFVDDPFDAADGARLYCTGDRVRYTSDGSIEFLGRQDHQIKLRGHRIELGEIESALVEDAAVNEAVVILYQATDEDKRLVAYLSLSDMTATITAKKLQKALLQQLPCYMVPSAYVFVDDMPRNANGKVTRELLPAPEAMALQQASDEAAPRTPLETEVTALWCDVLEREDVRLDDDFFVLGGHSLLATQLLVRVRDRFDVELSFQGFFADPTVSGMTAHILSERLGSARLETSLDELERISEKRAADHLVDLRLSSSKTPGE